MLGGSWSFWVVETTKDAKVIIFGEKIKPDLQWGFVFKGGNGMKIYNVNGSKENFSLEI